MAKAGEKEGGGGRSFLWPNDCCIDHLLQEDGLRHSDLEDGEKEAIQKAQTAVTRQHPCPAVVGSVGCCGPQHPPPENLSQCRRSCLTLRGLVGYTLSLGWGQDAHTGPSLLLSMLQSSSEDPSETGL